jgi:23S rRNA G2069 N7-methylase RlmK/C1962 C5-methylase RlmI
MQASPFPVLRLKPKADARRIRHGHPWAWADDLVLDRRSRNIAPGALAVLEDAERVPLGVGVATVEARIGFRMLDRDASARRSMRPGSARSSTTRCACARRSMTRRSTAWSMPRATGCRA